MINWRNSVNKGNLLILKVDRVFVFITVWTFCILRQVFPNGWSTRQSIHNLPLSATPETIRIAWGQGDAGSLLDAALTWAQFKDLNPSSQYWIVHLWTPGMPILEVPLIWLARIGIPIFYTLTALTTFLWSYAIYLIMKSIKSYKTFYLFAFLFIMWANSWDSQYIFRDSIYYTEGISLGLITLGFGVLIRYHNYYLVGILLGLSLMVRHVNDLGITLLLYFVILKTIKYQMGKIGISSKQRVKYKRQSYVKFITDIKFVLITFIFSFMVTSPWRLILSPLHYGGYFFALSTASSSTPASIWAKEGGYWEDYDVNWACKLDPQKCISFYHSGDSLVASKTRLLIEAFKSVITNPIGYFQERLPYIWRHWAGDNFQAQLTLQRFITYLFLIISIYAIYLTVRNFIKFSGLSLAEILISSLIMGQILTLAIIHFESRYFIPLRLYALLLIYLLLDRFDTANKITFKI